MMNNRSKALYVLSALMLLSVSCDNTHPFPSEDEDPKYWCGTIDEYTLTSSDMTGLITTAIPDLAKYSDLIVLLLSDINIAKIKYNTTDPDGNMIVASGVITYPTSLKEYNHILSIQHGTQNINKGPSDQIFPIEAAPVFSGELVVMADLLGYGISKTDDLKHTYMHKSTSGTACADMILAAKEYLKSESNLQCTADSIRLIGYSQGGQLTIATLFELQKRKMGNQISLVWAGAGPYDLYDYYTTTIANPTKRKMGYMLYALEGIANGDRLDLDRRNIYAPEMFVNGKDSIFTKCYVSQWQDIVGSDANKVLNADFFKPEPEYGGNEDVQTIIRHMHSNSLVNIQDKLGDNIHIRFYHLPNDSYVPYSCSEKAVLKWKDNSELINLEYATEHPAGGAEFLIEYMGCNDKTFRLLKPFIPEVEKVLN